MPLDMAYPPPLQARYRRSLLNAAALHEEAAILHERLAEMLAVAGKVTASHAEGARAETERHLSRIARERTGFLDQLEIASSPSLVCQLARLARARSRRHRRSFYLTGVIHGEPVFAAVRDGELVAHDLLLQHARLVVALGDRFGQLDETAATLDGRNPAVMLTLIRACDSVESITLGPASPPPI